MENTYSVLRQDEKAILKLRSLYKKYGFMPYKMSKFEEYDLYVKNKDFLVSENVITFTDTDGKLMALKPDVTLSIIKNTEDNLNEVKKVYYNENVYRVSKGTNSYKEIIQSGLEVLGPVDSYFIYETLLLAAESLNSISKESVLDVSHLGIISSILEDENLTVKQEKEIVKCISEKNVYGIEAVLGENSKTAEALTKLIKAYGTTQKVLPVLKEIENDKNKDYIKELISTVLLLNENGYKNVRIDFSVINDMNYYNGFVFKGFVNGISSFILSGGQYDKLMKKMGKKVGAIGFAVYLDMLEELEETVSFDIDAVVLYNENISLSNLDKEIKKLSEKENSITMQKIKPNNLRYKRLYKITESGVEVLEDNA